MYRPIWLNIIKYPGIYATVSKFVLVPAVREASDEATGKKGAIYQILDMIVLRKINTREDIQAFKSEFEKKLRKYIARTI